MSISMKIRKGHNPLMPGRVLIAFDASKDHSELEFRETIGRIRARGDILHRGDTIVVLGVVHTFTHPFGYQTQASETFMGASRRAIEEQVSKKVKLYVKILQSSAEECETGGVDIEVRITAGFPVWKVVVQEVQASKASWVILDRSLRRDLRHYLEQMPCKTALVLDNLSTEVVSRTDTSDGDEKPFFSISKAIPSPALQSYESTEIPNPQYYSLSLEDGLGQHSKQEKSARYAHGETISFTSPVGKGQRISREQRSSDAPILCIGCGIITEPDIKNSMKFSFSEVQFATEDFSEDNLLGEGGYGCVYKGKLKDGQLIAAKVRKEASTQGFAEFHSEIYVLSFARHKNIVMLLGYCCKENLNILVYEYICNKSLEWHLFDNMENVLDWHRRYAIAVGTAKGLRFLHEECRGSPIIHRDMRPSNILLTHDFVPMLGDFGLAKWKINNEDVQTRILGTLGYLAPEYAENGIVSVRTDVYAFGIILIQLMSGRRVVDAEREDNNQSLRQWAVPLIEKLALHEFVDLRLKDSFDVYEMYRMARTAYMCVQTDPGMRPSMGEVLHLLEGQSDYHHLAEQFVPHFNK